MRHDRTGEPIDNEDQAPDDHPATTTHTCDNGWTDADADADHPQPCPTCRPQLAARLRAANRRRTTTQPHHTAQEIQHTLDTGGLDDEC